MKTVKIENVPAIIKDQVITNMSTDLARAFLGGCLEGEFLDRYLARWYSKYDKEIWAAVGVHNEHPSWVCFKVAEQHCDPNTREWVVFTNTKIRSVIQYLGSTESIGGKTRGVQVREFPLIISVDEHRAWLERVPYNEDTTIHRDELAAHGDMLLLRSLEDNELHYESLDFSFERPYQCIDLLIDIGDAAEITKPFKARISVLNIDPLE